jgi:hypothetical protein
VQIWSCGKLHCGILKNFGPVPAAKMQALFGRCFAQAEAAADDALADNDSPASRRLLGLDGCRGEAAAAKDLPSALRVWDSGFRV